MSHSKFLKRGKSHYIDNWNPSASKYINVCTICGRRGYGTAILEQDFIVDYERKAIYDELTKMFESSLTVDSYGRCEDCAKRLDEKNKSRT